MRGVSVIKMYFQPGTVVNGAVAQATALSQTVLKPLTPGINPPLNLHLAFRPERRLGPDIGN